MRPGRSHEIHQYPDLASFAGNWPKSLLEAVVSKKCLFSYLGVIALVLTCSQRSFSQEPAEKEAKPSTAVKDIDPLALQVLKAATDRIHNAKAYSFQAIVSRENLGTNGQVITQFSAS